MSDSIVKSLSNALAKVTEQRDVFTQRAAYAETQLDLSNATIVNLEAMIELLEKANKVNQAGRELLESPKSTQSFTMFGNNNPPAKDSGTASEAPSNSTAPVA